MRVTFKYYVVDTVAETVVGSFEAISLDMAKAIMKKSILDNDKLNGSVEQFALYKDTIGIDVCETFSDVKEHMCPVSQHDWVVVKV